MLFGTDKDVAIVGCYLPPENSNFYEDKDDNNGVYLLYNELLDFLGNHKDDVYLLCTGDCNARVGNMSDIDENEKYLPVIGENEDDYCTSFSLPRKSRDNVVNKFGKALLNVCKMLQIYFVNGRSKSDSDGQYTFISSNGRSVIDYCIMSAQLFYSMKDFIVKEFDLSEHFPIICIFEVIKVVNINEEQRGSDINRFKWKEEKRSNFIENFNTEYVEEKLLSLDVDLQDKDVNGAVKIMTDIFEFCASEMKCIKKPTCISKQPTWWDKECEVAKSRKNRALNTYRKSNTEEDLNLYREQRRIFKNLCNHKEKCYNQLQIDKCLGECDNSNMWQKIKNLTRGAFSTNITNTEWVQYFKSLFESAKFEIDNDFETEANSLLIDLAEGRLKIDVDELDKPIEQSDVKEALSKMKNNKAPGLDGLVVEMYKNSLHQMSHHLVKLFNIIYETGVFPMEWGKAIICPMFKRGDKNATENYRGISLLNVISKIFTKIMNNRLTSWAEYEGILLEQQSGFRQNHSTIDNCFVLQASIYKYISKSKGRLYCFFIDFSKAFDCVQHNILLHTLLKKGVSTKFVQVLKSMYSQLSSCVRNQNSISDFFPCNLGTRQGCMLSPLLFIMFIGEFSELLEKTECKGIYVDEALPNVMQLLFADDVVNFADTILNLQNQIKLLEKFCIKYGMKINLQKSKIMVFRRGGVTKKTEKWCFEGEKIDIVSSYKYLGMYFTSIMSWELTKKSLCISADKALFIVYRFIKLYNVSMKQIFCIFDRMIVPILTYGAEIWGCKMSKCIESVHIKFCRRIMKLRNNTPESVVLGELGRYPLMVQYYKKFIAYWLKLLYMDDTRYPKRLYLMLLQLENAGKIKGNWASDVKSMLYRYGFHYVWLHQGVGNHVLFLKEFVQRVQDNYIQEWQSSISSYSKLDFYCRFKIIFEPERYIEVIKNKQYM